MGVYKEGKNWKVQVYYKDWQGNRKRKQKRGFRTKGEAKEWERDFLQQQTQPSPSSPDFSIYSRNSSAVFSDKYG